MTVTTVLAVAALSTTACSGAGSTDLSATPDSGASASPAAASTTSTAAGGTTGRTTVASPAATAAPTATAPPAPSAVRLLHDGAPPEPGIEENTPWRPTAVRVTVCWQDVPLTGAQEHRAVTALVDMERWSEGLVVFATAEQAVRFVEVARISVTECAAGDGSPWQGRQQRLDGAWGEGVAISYGSAPAPSQSPSAPMGETTVVLARVGRAVTYAQRGSHGILGETVNARGVAELRPALDHVAPQLCRYTRAGC
ncbi:hypothetical protein [Knoellia flava]|nr:hypothetical protein [Knoellia flava]